MYYNTLKLILKRIFHLYFSSHPISHHKDFRVYGAIEKIAGMVVKIAKLYYQEVIIADIIMMGYLGICELVLWMLQFLVKTCSSCSGQWAAGMLFNIVLVLVLFFCSWPSPWTPSYAAPWNKVLKEIPCNFYVHFSVFHVNNVNFLF